MFKKNDPLVQSVQKVMQENSIRREVEARLCEELGIYSKRELPTNHHANYDALLEQRIAEALHPNQQKLDVHEPEKDKLTAQDFKMLRAMGKKKQMEEESKSSSDPDMEAPRHPSQGGKKYDDEIEPKGKEKEVPVPPKRPADLKEASYDEETELDEVLDTKEKRKEYVDKAKSSVGRKIMKSGLKRLIGMKGAFSKDDDRTVQNRIKGISRAGDRQTAAYLSHMTGNRMPGVTKRKIKKEEVEQVDEVLDTANKKFKYIEKAGKQIMNYEPYKDRDGKGADQVRKRTAGAQMLQRKIAKKGVGPVVDEEQVYEGVMSRIKVGKSKKTPDGTEAGVKYKGRNIGKIQKYGEKYGAESPYQDMMYAGARSPEEAINALRKTEADRLRGIRTIKKYLSTNKKMNEEEDDKPKFADGNKVTPILSKLSDQERKDYDKASAEVEKMRGKPIDLSKPGDSAKSEPEKTPTAATSTPSTPSAPSAPSSTPKSDSSEFSNPRGPSGAKRVTAAAVSDYEKEGQNRERLNAASIEGQKKELESQKAYDAVMQQRNAYSKEREEKGIVPKKYRWESAGEINEKKLTDAEMAKRERFVRSMKKNIEGFKQRYGERAKSVMYATATKQAKNKEEKND